MSICEKYTQEKTELIVWGGALEEYIKDMFSSTFNITNESERLKKWSETFSYLGNQNNPPDSMLKNGDSIEVKNRKP